MAGTDRRVSRDQAELMVLGVLREEPLYGYAISKRLAARSDGAVRLTPGGLYPLLARLEKAGLVETEWEEVKASGAAPEAAGRRRKWYRLSPKGRRRLEQRIEAHRQFHRMIESIISGGAGEGEAAT